MRRNKMFIRFYNNLSKAMRVSLYHEVTRVLGMAPSTFYYKATHGSFYPQEALQIKDILLKYGFTQEGLLSMGVLE